MSDKIDLKMFTMISDFNSEYDIVKNYKYNNENITIKMSSKSGDYIVSVTKDTWDDLKKLYNTSDGYADLSIGEFIIKVLSE